MKNLKKLAFPQNALGFASVLLLLTGCSEDTSPVSVPRDKLIDKSIYADSEEVIRNLEQGTASECQEAVKRITSAPDRFTPPAFYALSTVLFEQGKKDEAAFWFYAGQLRGRFDANRCADKSARQAVQMLNLQYGTAINQYMFNRMEKLKALIPKVVEWDRKTPHNYDHRWINAHGMDAINAELSNSKIDKSKTSLPEEQWSRIAEKTRTDYLAAFQKVTSPTQHGDPKEFFSDPDVASLALAAENGDVEEIERLVVSGIDVNGEGTDGLTPLMWAMLANQKKSFRRLLELGADPNAQVDKGDWSFSRGDSPMSLAARLEDDPEWLKMALAHGGKVDLANPTDSILVGKKTPLFNAVASHNLTNLKLLIEAGANLNHRDATGSTATMKAASARWYEAVYLLLQSGADFRIEDNYGNHLAVTCLEHKVDRHASLEAFAYREKVLAFLTDNGVDLNRIETALNGKDMPVKADEFLREFFVAMIKSDRATIEAMVWEDPDISILWEHESCVKLNDLPNMEIRHVSPGEKVRFGANSEPEPVTNEMSRDDHALYLVSQSGYLSEIPIWITKRRLRWKISAEYLIDALLAAERRSTTTKLRQ